MQSHLNTQTEPSVLASSDPHTRGASIVAKAMVKKYGEFHALGPIDLDIKPGEFVSMIGPSGCGKSTTLLLASGLEPLTSGSIQIDGKALVKPISEVGIVFQDHLLLDFRTAMQNVMLQQEIRGLDKAKLACSLSGFGHAASDPRLSQS